MTTPTQQSHLILFSVDLKHRYGAFSVNLISWRMLPHTLGLKGHTLKYNCITLIGNFSCQSVPAQQCFEETDSEVHLT